MTSGFARLTWAAPGSRRLARSMQRPPSGPVSDTDLGCNPRQKVLEPSRHGCPWFADLQEGPETEPPSCEIGPIARPRDRVEEGPIQCCAERIADEARS